MMREIKIIRKKRFTGALFNSVIVVDGVAVAQVKNGEETKLTIDENSHEIFTYCNQSKSNVLRIRPGLENVALQINTCFTGFKLTPESANDNCEDILPPPVAPKSQIPSYICGFIISLILGGLSCMIYALKETSLLGFILGIIFSIACGVVFIMGGFWFIIIPLPHIAICKSGCNKPNLSMKRKIILGLLSFAFFSMALVALFTLRNIKI